MALLASAVAILAAVLALALLVALLRLRSRLRRELDAAHQEAAVLRLQVEEIERRLGTEPDPVPAGREYVITHLGEEPAPQVAPVPTIEATLFADQVLRETAVQAASWVHGLRRALAPETRNRIRFEIRREVKRSRKQRRADQREAKRQWAARQRATAEDTAA